MKYRRMGRTGLMASEIAFGGGRVGGIVIDPDDATKRRAVRVALDAGINWFDTAPQYGNGKSEEALGWLLAEVSETPHLSTKVMIDGNNRTDIAGQVTRSIDASLKRLRRDRIDVLQLHNHIEPEIKPDPRGRAITPDDVLGSGGVLEGMERARTAGKVRFLGLSALGNAAATTRVIESGRFDTAQIYYNMINPSAGRAMPPAWRGFDSVNLIALCRQHDMGVLAIRIFAASYLASTERTGRESVLTANTEPEAEAQMAEAAFAALGQAHGNRAQTALRFVLANPDISTAVVGAAAISHIEEAVAAEAMGPLPATALAALDRLYETGFKA